MSCCELAKRMNLKNTEMVSLALSLTFFVMVFIHGHIAQASSNFDIKSMANHLGNNLNVNNLSNLLKSVGFEMNLNREGLQLSFGSNNKQSNSKFDMKAPFRMNLTDLKDLPKHTIIPPSGSLPAFIMIPLPTANNNNNILHDKSELKEEPTTFIAGQPTTTTTTTTVKSDLVDFDETISSSKVDETKNQELKLLKLFRRPRK